jgi:hypothetical protein
VTTAPPPSTEVSTTVEDNNSATIPTDTANPDADDTGKEVVD